MNGYKFDPAKLERLNDPARFDTLPPAAMFAALGTATPRSIVEIGAGTGLFSAAFCAWAPQAVVYAADTEPAMVEWMATNRPEAADGRLVPLLSEEAHVPLGDGAADLVVMINVHHEFEDAGAMYREAARLLGHGGQLLVSDWAPVATPKGPPLSVRISEGEAARFVEDAGFDGVAAHPGLTWNWLVTGVRR